MVKFNPLHQADLQSSDHLNHEAFFTLNVPTSFCPVSWVCVSIAESGWPNMAAGPLIFLFLCWVVYSLETARWGW